MTPGPSTNLPINNIEETLAFFDTIFDSPINVPRDELHFEAEITDLATVGEADLILAADGFNSFIRSEYAEFFQPTMTFRPNRFVWLGTTRPFPAFTFYFKENAHGLWRVHAYQYEPGNSTFIVEATEVTWRASGLSEERPGRSGWPRPSRSRSCSS